MNKQDESKCRLSLFCWQWSNILKI